MAGAIDLGRLANFETITSAKRELPQRAAPCSAFKPVDLYEPGDGAPISSAALR
jgi:hypothetical protein